MKTLIAAITDSPVPLFLAVLTVMSVMAVASVRHSLGEVKADLERRQLLSQCEVLRMQPDTPQAVAAKCSRMIRDYESERKSLERDSLRSTYEKILSY